MSEPILSVEKVEVKYGAFVAVRNASLAVPEKIHRIAHRIQWRGKIHADGRDRRNP
jgi:ABC-type uncharacterized transport system ATPase subunit